MTSSVSPAAQRPWRQAFPAFCGLLVLTLILYRDTASAMVAIWLRSETFTHGFLVPPIVLWLVWRKRHVLAALTPRPSRWGWLLLAGAAFAWLLGDLVAVNSVTQLAFVSMLVLLVPALLGWRVAAAIAFPLAFLFFAVPFGEFAMPQLMVWTADFTVLALRASGIPVYREGLQFIIPSGAWSVIEACSGVRYLIASLTVGTLFAYLNYQSTRRRVLFIIVSLLVPIVANWLRAYMIVMLGHLSGNKLATGVDHIIYGWVFFGVVIMLMFVIGARWSEPEPSLAPSTAASGGTDQITPAMSTAVLLALTLLLALVVALPHLAKSALDASGRTGVPQLAAPASLADGWVASAQPLGNFTPAFENTSAQINAAYERDGHAVGLYLGYYRQQNYNRKLVSSDNVLVKSKDPLWAQVGSGSKNLVLTGTPVTVRTAQLRSASLNGTVEAARLAVWQTYWIDGSWIESDTMAKVYGALYRLLGHGDESAVIIVCTPAGPDAEATLTAFMQANAPDIESVLEKTRGQAP
jgi:exosortase A